MLGVCICFYLVILLTFDNYDHFFVSGLSDKHGTGFQNIAINYRLPRKPTQIDLRKLSKSRAPSSKAYKAKRRSHPNMNASFTGLAEACFQNDDFK